VNHVNVKEVLNGPGLVTSKSLIKFMHRTHTFSIPVHHIHSYNAHSWIRISYLPSFLEIY
jgi:hypothetical protein